MTNRRNALIESRAAKGPRKKVATDLGISIIYLRMIENGTHKPGRDVMLRIASYLGKPLDFLFPDLFQDNKAV